MRKYTGTLGVLRLSDTHTHAATVQGVIPLDEFKVPALKGLSCEMKRPCYLFCACLQKHRGPAILL